MRSEKTDLFWSSDFSMSTDKKFSLYENSVPLYEWL